MALTKKQRAFLEAYLETWNASEAARRSGYRGKRPDQAGYEYLRKPEVAAAVESHIAQIMPAGEVLQLLADHARSTVGDFIDVTVPSADLEGATDMDDAKAIAGGWRLNLVKAEQAGKLHLIKKIKSGQWGPEIELHDAQAALTLLGKHHRLFVDRTEHTGADGAPIEVSDARDKLAALLTRRAQDADTAADPGGDGGAEE